MPGINGKQEAQKWLWTMDLKFPSLAVSRPLLGDPDGAPLNFGNIGSTQGQINELGPQAYRQSGVRVGKWEIALGAIPNNMSNDYAIFRYADVLLMKAEALMEIRSGCTGISFG